MGAYAPTTMNLASPLVLCFLSLTKGPHEDLGTWRLERRVVIKPSPREREHEAAGGMAMGSHMGRSLPGP